MSEAKMAPGALSATYVNLFEGTEVIDIPTWGSILCGPSAGLCVMVRGDVIYVVSLISNPADETEVIGAIRGMTAEIAHGLGAQLISAATKVGGDRGLQ